MLRPFSYLLLCVLVLSSCKDWFLSPKPKRPGIVDTYIPIYAKEGDPELAIATGPVRATKVAGKIFSIGDKLFQVEDGAGIHIIDYSDRTKPRKLAFLNVPGCREVALKGGTLFTNSYEDMLLLDLGHYPDVTVRSRIPNVFPQMGYSFPPLRGAYYECPDYSKGKVVGWEIKKVKNPNCYY